MESELASPGATKPVGKSFLKNSSNFFHATPEAKKCSLSCFSCGSEGALGCRRKCCSSTLAKNSCEDARCTQIKRTATTSHHRPAEKRHADGVARCRLCRSKARTFTVSPALPMTTSTGIGSPSCRPVM
eukprot:scaffold421_cov125-Isochrysis_galbana.AAC.2